ncbi:unnamed protein product [Phytophthora fragariaefolia]|uniref:Unnamed protein product n=1 Tax=Phytophthora fragariaefolia TaxID=1490495 RepID=A0A9W6XZD0_9STRA|nr:unnamed protein product [Phytophthora fragariaefolia]
MPSLVCQEPQSFNQRSSPGPEIDVEGSSHHDVPEALRIWYRLQCNELTLAKKAGPQYVDLKWRSATSVNVERLFSTTKCTLVYLRKSINAETLKMILYLRLNLDLVTNEVSSKTLKTAGECRGSGVACVGGRRRLTKSEYESVRSISTGSSNLKP